MKEVRGEGKKRGGTIADFFVLLLGELNEDLGCWMLDLEQGEDGRSVIGDRYVLRARTNERQRVSEQASGQERKRAIASEWARELDRECESKAERERKKERNRKRD